MRVSARVAALATAIAAFFQAAPASSQPQSAPLKLSAAERQIIASKMWRNDVGAIPIGFEGSVGTIVPPAIKLQSLPQPVVDQIPTLKPLDYAKSRNQILIVDPLTRKVVGVLNR